MAKDRDGDGIPDVNDPWPDDPTKPAQAQPTPTPGPTTMPTGPVVPVDANGNPIIIAGEQSGFTFVPYTPTDTGTGSSSTSKSYNQYTLQQVRGLAEDAIRNAIGRSLTEDELKRFQESLNAAEKATPTVSTTSGKSSVTSGGVDVTQFAKSTAQLAPEYANYQKATTYFDAMLSALRGPAGGGI